MTETKLTHKERVAWFIENHNQKGSYNEILLLLEKKNLDNFILDDKIIKIPRTIEERQKIKEDKMKMYWENNLTQFKDVKDIPSLPIANKDTWIDFYIPKLIELGAIPQDKLIDGATYRGRTRNATIAMWDKKNKDFIHYRYSFGQKYRDTVNHFEDDNGFALFVPIKLIRKS